MKIFSCSTCHQTVFFENVSCTRCGHALAYLPDRGLVSGIEPVDAPESTTPADAPPGQRWRALAADGAEYRLCRNGTEYGVCNWAVPAEDAHELCRACRLNVLIPPLGDPAARAAWALIEAAKRRLVYSLLQLGLPVDPRFDDPQRGLAFRFMKELPGEKVTTGHADGVITLDVAEASDPHRESTRVKLGEPYRTLLGHFRHEIGHYYWLRLVSATPWLSRCRERFGDDRADYAEALRVHYERGAPAGWQERFVSAYASMHPAEDWAETFAHHLHLVDTLETARALGLSVRAEPTAQGDVPLPKVAARAVDPGDFDALLGAFVPLTLALNELNRSMGLQDTYPFVLSPPAIDKLRFVHEVVAANADCPSQRS
ncbi:MAG: putative zinc-binding metallopeptidase [Anaeromyxobacteraceae bacterium]